MADYNNYTRSETTLYRAAEGTSRKQKRKLDRKWLSVLRMKSVGSLESVEGYSKEV